jgi:hypothetical protein
MSDNKRALAEFKDFVLQGNVVDLAVAVIIAMFFGVVIKDIVNLILSILAIPGKTNKTFADLHFTIGHGVFNYGVPDPGSHHLRDRGGGGVFRGGSPGGGPDAPPAGRARARKQRPGLPGVSERHPEGGYPVRLLHFAGGPGSLSDQAPGPGPASR